MDLDPLQIAAGVLVFLLCANILWLARIEMRLRRLFRGKTGVSLEDTVHGLDTDIKHTSARQAHLEKTLEDAAGRLARSVQGISIVRFNPFKGTSGSNQSFAAALLDSHKNGVVFSSLYSRERVSVFAKPIAGGSSEYDLSAEEKQAVAEASKNIAQN